MARYSNRALALGASALALALPVVSGLSYWEIGRRARFAFEHARYHDDEANFAVEHVILKPLRSNGTRVWLFHGFRSDRSYWSTQPHDHLVSELDRRNYETVIVDLPYTYASHFADGGASYCERARSWLAKIRKIVDDELGPARQTYFIGTSWGGFHSLLLADRSINGVAAVKPVVRVSALSELWMVDNDACTPEANIENLRNINSIVTWGTSDYRVDYRHTHRLFDAVASAAPGSTLALVREGEAHVLDASDYADVLAWLDKQSGTTARARHTDP